MIQLLLRTIIFLFNIIYFFLKLLPTQNKIVMISRQSNNINTDFKLLGEKLSSNYDIVYLCKTLDGGVNSSIKTRISYGFHMFKQVYHLATSKACILDSYSPAVCALKHKKTLKIVQIWHSIGTMKKFGYAILDKEEGSNAKIAHIMKMHNNYDLIFASSDAYKEHLASGFNCSIDKIKTLTLPHIDYINDKKYISNVKKKIFFKYPELKHKKNIVYCPTFRKNDSQFEKALKDLIKNMDFSKYNLIVKVHPLSKVNIKNKKVIFDREFSTFDMLFIADYCISDYSCIIYEAGLMGIPIYFYNYDMKKYVGIRGLAIDYQELPGFICKTGQEVAESLEKRYNKKYLKKFINKYVTNSHNCTEKAVKAIEELID